MSVQVTLQPTPLRMLMAASGIVKEIAAYLGRDVTTVRRWEKREAASPSSPPQ